ncbi:glycosyltransferase involved in cell wall biosynthesis [Chitinophaga skermanii]|uniref:Glycosyltransferase involved in cell wall biosynthesis n=1 Tax=Chitinophaga skermanii TaxID=331697 RepID=A0A327QR95_9BACT|nr:glycosyltransferase [Chitinophaga skermanii]RAJ06558.1 glycosyltransferase involved in cell wall biosynthesis [Chitinophaga skermanii]
MEISANATPIVSIIIATYNAEKDVQDCLQSIVQQHFQQFEVLLMDAGSKDRTADIAAAFNDPRIKFHQAADKGIYDAFNKGVNEANGKWIYFLGADDRLLPGFSDLAKQLKDPRTIYYGDSVPYYGDATPGMELLGGEFSSYRLAKHCMNHQTIFYPATVFQLYKYQLKYKIYADYALNIQAWGDRRFRQQYIPVLIARYNMMGFSSSHNDPVFRRDKLMLIKQSMGWWMYWRLLFKNWKKRYQGEKNFWEPVL